MLMMTHRSDIDHILHDLKQIESLTYDASQSMELFESSKKIAHEVTEEFMTLLHNLETEEWMHKSIIYDDKMMEDMCMIAYYMSFYNWNDLAPGTSTVEEACIECAKSMGCHAMSIMNMKSLYDDYIYSAENHWAKPRRLLEDMKFVMDICDGMTQEEALDACYKKLNMM